MTKYDDLFKKYNFKLTDEQVKAEVAAIVSKNFESNNHVEVYKKCLSLIDLTSLNGTDTHREIETMVEKVNGFPAAFPHLPNVGAICVYPALVPSSINTSYIPFFFNENTKSFVAGLSPTIILFVFSLISWITAFTNIG